MVARVGRADELIDEGRLAARQGTVEFAPGANLGRGEDVPTVPSLSDRLVKDARLVGVRQQAGPAAASGRDSLHQPTRVIVG
jgi:ribosomal protein L27